VKLGTLQGHVHSQKLPEIGVNGLLRVLKRETELAQTLRLTQAHFDRIARALRFTSVPGERMGLT
jgi:hypothetical protein